MNKLFYYDDETENKLDEKDAEETTYEEVVEEVYELDDDDVSYVGIILSDGRKYRFKSGDYDVYKIYKYDDGKGEFLLSEYLNFEECKSFIRSLF